MPVVQTAPLWLSHPGPVTAAGPRLENDAKPWLAETHVGVRRVWWAGAALQRPAGDTEVPHRPPPSRGGKEPGTRPAAPASPASWPRQPQPAPRDPACLRSRRPAPRLTSPRLAHRAEEPPAARAGQPLCVRAPACVRGPVPRSREHAAAAPPPLRPRAGPGGAARGWGAWFLAADRPDLGSDLLALSGLPQASRCRALRAPAASVWIFS